jgi:hypothetical protein
LPFLYDRERKKWPFNTGDCSIEVTSSAGLTVFIIPERIVSDVRNDIVYWFSKNYYLVCIVLKSPTPTIFGMAIIYRKPLELWYTHVNKQYVISRYVMYSVGVYCLYSQTCRWGHLYWAVTCIKRSLFSFPVIENFIWIEPLLRGHLS